MKVRVTIMTENDVPFEKIASVPNVEEKVKAAWDYAIKLINTMILGGGETAYVESTEIIKEE